MINTFFSHDEPAALAYAAYKATAAGDTNHAAELRHSFSFSTWLASTAAAIFRMTAALLKRDEPAALAYEAQQMAEAGYTSNAVSENSEILSNANRSARIHAGAAAIIAWDKQLRLQNAPRHSTIRPARSYNPR
jgi:hypothetical protein